MAEMKFDVKANYDEITKARAEMERFRQELLKTNKSTDKNIVADLTDKYTEQRSKVQELTSAMSRYATVMSSNYMAKMQQAAKELYNYELQIDAVKRSMESTSSEIAKIQKNLRLGNLDFGQKAIATDNLKALQGKQSDNISRLANLKGLAEDAKISFQGMTSEYERYAGGSKSMASATDVASSAIAQMIERFKDVPTAGEGASSLFQRLTGDAKLLSMSLMGGLGFEQLAQRIFSTRSEFQQLEISFTTMLGSEIKAGSLMNQLIDTAAKTPFDMGSITEGAKQLLAYGTQANEVNDILVHLGDIAAGLNIPLSQLVYLYGTTMAQGRMFTMDLRQFMGRGIPMAEELGKIMGKSTQEVQDAVSKGKVGADLVKKAIMNMSSEGGKFGGLMEKQSASLSGQWANIGDSVDQMFNEIGKKSEGVFGAGLDFITLLVENWQAVTKVIGTAAVAVGTYKAGLMAAATVQKLQNQATLNSITEGLDASLNNANDTNNKYRHLNGKGTSGWRSNSLKGLGDAIGSTENIGDVNQEMIVSAKIKEAEAEGLITSEMAKQLQAKRDLLVAQEQVAQKEKLEYDLAQKARMEAEAKAEQERLDAEIAAKLTKDNNTRNTDLYKARTNTDKAEKEKQLAKEKLELAKQQAQAEHDNIANIDAQIEKQKEVVAQKKELVKQGLQNAADNGGYEDAFTSASYDEDAVLKKQLRDEYNDAQRELVELQKQRAAAANAMVGAEDRVKEAEKASTEASKEFVEAMKAENEEYGKASDEIRDSVDALMEEEAAESGNTASTQSNTTAKSTNSTAKGTNTTTTQANTTAENSNTTSNNLNTTSERANTVATQANTVAESSNSLATKTGMILTRAYASTKAAFTVVINNCTASLRAMWAAMLANPITGIITLVTTAISIFAMFKSEEDDAASAAEKMGDKAAEASNKMRTMFAVLESSKGKEDAHKDTINELKSAYEQYGIELDKTKMKSEDMSVQAEELKAHEEELIGIIEKRAIEMQKANDLESAYSSYSESNNTSYGKFAKDVDDDLNSNEASQVRNIISQSDLALMAEYQSILDDTNSTIVARQSAEEKLKGLMAEQYVALGNYLKALGKTDEQINDIIPSYKEYIDSLIKNKQKLEEDKQAVEDSASAAERARSAVANLTDAQDLQALKNQFVKKTFKELNSDIQQTISLCNKKYGFTIKVNYDDSELPKWIKNMSQKQLKSSMAVRQNFLNSHKKGDILNLGGQYKTYEQVATELAMMQARGSNEESKPTESEAEKKKKQKAAEKAAKAAAKAQSDKESRAGNTRKANEAYDNTIQAYSEKAEDAYETQRIKQIKDSTERQIAEINASTDKQKAALEEGIDKLVDAKKKRDQAIWTNGKTGRKSNQWKQSKTDEEYRQEVMNTTMTDKSGNSLGMTIGENMKAQVDAIEKEREKSIAKVAMQQSQSLYDYLKQYGSVEQQRYAITKEYDEKIAKETDEWKKKSLEREKGRSLADIDIKRLETEIDWSTMFDGVAKGLEDEMKRTLDNVEAFIQSDKFKSLDANDKQSYISLRNNLRQKTSGGVGAFNFGIYGDIAKDLTAYQNAVKDALVAQEAHKKALEELATAEENAKNATTEGDKLDAKGALGNAKALVEQTASELENANSNVDASKNKLQSDTDSARVAINNFSNALSQMNSGSLSGFANGLASLIQAIGGNDVKGLEGLGKAGGIVGAILSIIDSLGDDPAQFFEDLLEKIFNVISKLIEQFNDMSFITTLIESVIKGIGNLINSAMASTFDFGITDALGISSLFGGSDKDYEEDMEDLTKSNEALQKAIENLSDIMDDTSVIDSQNIYNQQLKNLQQVEKQTQEQLSRTAADYSNGTFGIGGKHSTNKRIDDAMSSSDWSSISKAAGVSVRSASDFFKLTSQQMKDVSEQATAAYMKLYEHADDGYRDATEYIDSYIALAEQYEELQNTFYEKVTNFSFDSMYSEFESALLDMDSSAEDFADNFESMMQSAVINGMMSNKYKQKLQEWYNNFAQAMSDSGGTLTKKQQDSFNQSYTDIVNEALNERDQLKKTLGWSSSSSQSASSGTFQTMSQETGDELSGRFTALQIAGEGILTEAQAMNSKLDEIITLNGGGDSVLTANISSITGNVAGIYSIADEGRTLLAQQLLALQSIDERQDGWNKPMLQAFSNLKEIRDKIKAI